MVGDRIVPVAVEIDQYEVERLPGELLHTFFQLFEDWRDWSRGLLVGAAREWSGGVVLAEDGRKPRSCDINTTSLVLDLGTIDQQSLSYSTFHMV